MKRIFIILLLLPTLVNVKAQTNAMSLEECMLYAVENSPVTAKQIAQNKIHRENYKQAIGNLLPSVSANSSANLNFGRALDENNTYTDVNSFSNNYGANASLMLFDGLSSIYNLKMQKINRLAGKHELDQRQDMLSYDVMEQFFNVQYFQEMVKLAAEQLEESSNNLKQVQRMEELGVKGFPDVAEIRAKQASDNYNLTRQRNLLAIAVIKLKEVMNFPIDEQIEIEPYEPAGITGYSETDALTIYNRSIGRLPKALAANAAYESSRYAYKATKGRYYPTLSLNGGISSNFYRLTDSSDFMAFKSQLKNKRGEYIGINLSIPIFSGFSNSSAVKKSKYQMRIAELEKEETMRQLYSEIEQAVADMNGQADEFVQAQRQAEAMQIAHDVNMRKYNEGLASALEIYTSSNRLLEAKVEEQNAKLKYYLKSKLVAYYSGEPFITIAE